MHHYLFKISTGLWSAYYISGSVLGVFKQYLVESTVSYEIHINRVDILVHKTLIYLWMLYFSLLLL